MGIANYSISIKMVAGVVEVLGGIGERVQGGLIGDAYCAEPLGKDVYHRAVCRQLGVEDGGGKEEDTDAAALHIVHQGDELGDVLLVELGERWGAVVVGHVLVGGLDAVGHLVASLVEAGLEILERAALTGRVYHAFCAFKEHEDCGVAEAARHVHELGYVELLQVFSRCEIGHNTDGGRAAIRPTIEEMAVLGHDDQYVALAQQRRVGIHDVAQTETGMQSGIDHGDAKAVGERLAVDAEGYVAATDNHHLRRWRRADELLLYGELVEVVVGEEITLVYHCHHCHRNRKEQSEKYCFTDESFHVLRSFGR